MSLIICKERTWCYPYSEKFESNTLNLGLEESTLQSILCSLASHILDVWSSSTPHIQTLTLLKFRVENVMAGDMEDTESSVSSTTLSLSEVFHCKDNFPHDHTLWPNLACVIAVAVIWSSLHLSNICNHLSSRVSHIKLWKAGFRCYYCYFTDEQTEDPRN